MTLLVLHSEYMKSQGCETDCLTSTTVISYEVQVKPLPGIHHLQVLSFLFWFVVGFVFVLFGGVFWGFFLFDLVFLGGGGRVGFFLKNTEVLTGETTHIQQFLTACDLTHHLTLVAYDQCSPRCSFKVSAHARNKIKKSPENSPADELLPIIIQVKDWSVGF